MMSTSPFDGHSPLTPSVHHAGHSPGARLDAAAHLEAAVLPAVEAAGVEARRRVFGVLAVALPVAAARLVVRVRLLLAAPFDDEHAAFDARVVLLVPLILFVADEALLVTPVGRAGTAVDVELVGPDQPVAGGDGDAARAVAAARAAGRAASDTAGSASAAAPPRRRRNRRAPRHHRCRRVRLRPRRCPARRRRAAGARGRRRSGRAAAAAARARGRRRSGRAATAARARGSRRAAAAARARAPPVPAASPPVPPVAPAPAVPL